jgi:hypothetical protein
MTFFPLSIAGKLVSLTMPTVLTYTYRSIMYAHDVSMRRRPNKGRGVSHCNKRSPYFSRWITSE